MRNIHLLQPENGSLTEPLQLHVFPDGTKEESEDFSQPRGINFRWEGFDAPRGEVFYRLALGKDETLATPLLVRESPAPHLRLVNLEIGTRYHWQVTAFKNGRKVAASAVWSFTTHSQTPRWIHAPKLTNLRDIGGWQLPHGKRIRQGMVYRSSELNNRLILTRSGKAVLEQQLGIRTDIDLRNRDEEPRPALEGDRTAYFNFTIMPYTFIADSEYHAAFAAIFRLLAEGSHYPVIIHCVGGADRTGTLVFLLQALLGLGREALYTEYELTTLSIWGSRDRFSPDFQGFLRALSAYAAPHAHLQMQAEGFLQSIGVSREEMQALRSLLVEAG